MINNNNLIIKKRDGKLDIFNYIIFDRDLKKFSFFLLLNISVFLLLLYYLQQRKNLS